MVKKYALVALKFLISGGLIWYLLSAVDVSAVKARLADADLVLLGLAGLTIILQVGVAGARWWAVMRGIGHPLPWLELARLFYIGSFFSQALPSSVGGDPIRIYMAYKDGVPLIKAINGVFLERVAAMVALVVVVVLVQPAFVGKLDATGRSLAVMTISLLVVGIIVGVVVLMCLDRLPESFRRFKIVRGLASLAQDTRDMTRNWSALAASMLFGVLTHINTATVVYFIALALSVDVRWLDCLVLIPLVILVTTLPISIAGWGVRESAMVAALALVGVAADAALSVSLTLGLLAIVTMIPGGLLWLTGRHRDGAVSAEEAASAVESELNHLADEPINKP